MELIDRRKLVSDFWKGVEDCAILSYEDTDELMENASTVDAVEVVRCKDCKYYEKIPDWGRFMCTKFLGLTIPNADDFCSYGERKDNDETVTEGHA